MTTLPDLITAAAAGGPHAPMPLSLAAALTTLVAEDHANPQTPPYTGLPVTIEVDNGGGIAEYTVQVGDLRYSLCAEDTDHPAYRLCREDGCSEIAAGKTPLTRVCRGHMNTLQRLDAWETETREALSHLEGDLRLIAQIIDRRT
jgi:hypothetical protein